MRRLAVAALLVLVAGCASDRTGAPDAADPEPPPTVASPSAASPSVPGEDLASAEDEALAGLAAEAQSQAAAIEADAIAPRSGPVLGADFGWPQCPAGLGIEHKISTGAPLPTAEAEYVVIGLTNGPGFHVNPCLADQVAWARGEGLLLGAYSVISWPDAAAQAEHGGLRQAGRAQAEFNIASMRAAGLEVPFVWLDVEHVPDYDWPSGSAEALAANAEVVRGAAQGYLDAGYAIGVYSTPYLWEQVVGDLSLGVPEWRAAGQTSMAEALSRCGADWSIQGGEAVLGQWVQDDRDKNVTCPGAETRLGEFFNAP